MSQASNDFWMGFALTLFMFLPAIAVFLIAWLLFWAIGVPGWWNISGATLVGVVMFVYQNLHLVR